MASPGFPAAGPGWESPQGRGCAGALPHQLPPRSLGFPLAFYLKRRPGEHGLFPCIYIYILKRPKTNSCSSLELLLTAKGLSLLEHVLYECFTV